MSAAVPRRRMLQGLRPTWKRRTIIASQRRFGGNCGMPSSACCLLSRQSSLPRSTDHLRLARCSFSSSSLNLLDPIGAQEDFLKEDLQLNEAEQVDENVSPQLRVADHVELLLKFQEELQNRQIRKRWKQQYDLLTSRRAHYSGRIKSLDREEVEVVDGKQAEVGISGVGGNQIDEDTAFWQGLALLRTLTQSEWRSFDLLEDDGVISVDNELRLISQNEMIFENLVAHDADLEQPDDGDVHQVLSTDEANRKLVYLALSSDLDSEAIMVQVMNTYSHLLSEDSLKDHRTRPNQLTHEILLLTLHRRLASSVTALDVITDIFEGNSAVSFEPDTLLAVAEVLYERRELELAMRVLKHEFYNPGRLINIPRRVFKDFLHLAKLQHSQTDALDILNMCLDEVQRGPDRKVDNILLDTISWPSYPGSGSTEFLVRFTKLLHKNRHYIPGNTVWKRLATDASKGVDVERHQLVRHSLQMLLGRSNHPRLDTWLTHAMLDRSLLACEILSDTKLSAEVTLRFLQKEAFSIHTKPSENGHALPLQSISRALSICIQHGDTTAAVHIIDQCTLMGRVVPPAFLESLYLICLKGQVTKGEMNEAQQLLEEMKQCGLGVSEEMYGTILHGYAIAGEHEKATNLLLSLNDGGDVRPGKTCYDGFILSCVRSQLWHEGLDAFEAALQKDISLSATTTHALILSAHRAGGIENVQNVVGKILDSETEVNRDVCILVLRLLLPLRGIDSNVQDIRDDVRNLGRRAEGINDGQARIISDALRTAELLDERLQGSVHGEKQQTPWFHALSTISSAVNLSG